MNIQKVYVLTGEIEYEGEDILGIYTSEAKAKEYKSHLEPTNKFYDSFRVEEYALDVEPYKD